MHCVSRECGAAWGRATAWATALLPWHRLAAELRPCLTPNGAPRCRFPCAARRQGEMERWEQSGSKWVPSLLVLTRAGFLHWFDSAAGASKQQQKGNGQSWGGPATTPVSDSMNLSRCAFEQASADRGLPLCLLVSHAAEVRYRLGARPGAGWQSCIGALKNPSRQARMGHC